jgi:WD40 repeat protein
MDIKMETQENVVTRRTASLMISYSRKDKVFVRQLYDSLVAQGFLPDDIWVDWEGIPLSADWMAEITKGIQSSNAFIFVISPDSVASEVCKKEIELAVESNKRFIPILHREPGRDAKLHEKISSHNWVFIRDEQELEKTLPALIEAINTDLDWLAQHTRLFNRAKEWEGKGRNDSYLVRGNDLQDAETFISQGAAGKEPAPTPLHIEYVTAARKHAAAVRRRNRIIAAVVGVALLGLSIFALIQWGNAEAETVRANDNASTAVAEQVRADSNAATAQANEQIAIENEEIANALALASESINQKNSNTQLSLMLALLSIQETSQDSDIPLHESKSALFSSLNTPNVLHTWENGSIVTAVAYDPTGNYIAIGNEDGLVQVIDAQDRSMLYPLQFEDAVSGLDFSPDGERLGISSDDGSAIVVSAENGNELFSLAGHDGYYVSDIKFSPDGNLIATGGGDWYVKIWNAVNGSLRVTLPSHTDAVTSIDFSPDSTRLVSGSYDDTVILWDLETNSLLNKFRPDGFDTAGNRINSVAFNPWGSRIIASGRPTVVVWDAIDFGELQRLRGNRANVYAVNYAPDGLSMLTASAGVKIWDYYLGTERYNLSSHRGEVTAATFSRDGLYILTGSWDTTAKLWAANLLIDNFKIKYNVGQNLDANYSPDGQYFVVSDAWGNVIVYLTQTGEVIEEWSTEVWTNQASFDPQDSRRVLTGDDNGLVSVWEIGRSDPLLQIQAHDGEVFSAAFSPDGTAILSAGSDDIVRLWRAQNGEPMGELTVDGRLVRARFNPDGSLIIAAGFDAEDDNEAYIFDTASGEQLVGLRGHTDEILALAFSRNGNYVYTAGFDNTIRKWDAATGEVLLVMTGHTGRVVDLAVSPNDGLVASASADTTVRVWDAGNGKELFTYLGNNEDANSVAFSMDGNSVLTASSDETTKEFTIDYETLLAIAQEYELRPLTAEECQRFLYRDDCTLTLFGGAPPANEVSSSSAPQSTPTPAQQSQPAGATPTPAPVSASGSQAFYTEEFDGGLDTWDGFMATGTDNQVEIGADGGSLFVQLSPDAEKTPRFYLVNPDSEYSNVQVEVSTTNYGNNANGVSLVCHYDGTYWYEFTVSNAGLYSINAYDPSATALQGYIQLAGGGSGAIKSGQEAVNVYRAVCNGNELTLYINDVLITTIDETRYNLTGGKIGLGVSSPQMLPVEVSFEYLTVSQP